MSQAGPWQLRGCCSLQSPTDRGAGHPPESSSQDLGGKGSRGEQSQEIPASWDPARLLDKQ